MTVNDFPIDYCASIFCDDKNKNDISIAYDGQAQILNLFRFLQDCFNEVLVVTSQPLKYEDLGLNIIHDILPNKGPLGCIVSSLLVTKFDRVFILPTNFDKISNDQIVSLLDGSQSNDVTLFVKDGELLTNLGIYTKNCLQYLEGALFDNNLSLNQIFQEMNSSLIIDYIELAP